MPTVAPMPAKKPVVKEEPKWSRQARARTIGNNEFFAKARETQGREVPKAFNETVKPNTTDSLKPKKPAGHFAPSRKPEPRYRHVCVEGQNMKVEMKRATGVTHEDRKAVSSSNGAFFDAAKQSAEIEKKRK